MKWLVYLMLLVNLGIFVWHYQGLEKKTEQGSLDRGTQLVLLREYLEGKEQKAAPESGSDSSQCYSLGPFSKSKSANAAQEVLAKAKVTAWQRIDRDAIRTGYWVYLPPAADRQAASVSMANLKQLRIKDYFMVATGEMKYAISLGVFSKSKLARARMQSIVDKGFRAKVKKMTLPKRVYWIDWEKQAAQQPDKVMLDKMKEQFKGIGQTERRCSPKQANS